MRHRKVKLIVATMVCAAAIAFVFLGDTAVRQHFRLRKANGHRPVIESQLAQHASMADVKVGSWTGGGGMIFVYGSVSTPGEAEELKRIVAETNPPVGVRYSVTVKPLD